MSNSSVKKFSVLPPIIVRQVWHYNIIDEFLLIRSALPCFPYVAMDTEFPGTIYNHLPHLSAEANYSIMKKNVDATKLIQLGLTLSDAEGNLPHFGTGFCYIWEFNFRDFDVDQDLQNPESIDLLKRQGIDFLMNKKFGILSFDFAMYYDLSRLAWAHNNQTWVTFHSSYDFGFLIKMLCQCQLPNNLSEFMDLVKLFFGRRVFDMKHMMGFCGLKGGLEQMAKSLNVNRVAGKKHQAGSDSLLMMQAFIEWNKIHFNGSTTKSLDEFNYELFELATVY